jgi:hypothetical protein
LSVILAQFADIEFEIYLSRICCLSQAARKSGFKSPMNKVQLKIILPGPASRLTCCQSRLPRQESNCLNPRRGEGNPKPEGPKADPLRRRDSAARRSPNAEIRNDGVQRT